MGRSLSHPGVLELAGQVVNFRLFRVAGRRRIHVLVNDEGELQVRAPWHFSLAGAKDVIAEHDTWVLASLDEARQRLRRRPRLVSGCELPLFDETLRLRISIHAQLGLFAECHPADAHDPGCPVRRRGKHLDVALPALGMGEVRALVESWYRCEATTVLPQRLGKFEHLLAVTPRRVTVRAQRSCWGSCSENGTVSLNWRLLLVPGRLADYILVHELAHLRHLDHSPAFWGLVGSIMPDYAARRDALRTLEGRLPI